MQQNNCKSDGKTTRIHANQRGTGHLNDTKAKHEGNAKRRVKLKKSERRRQILLELKLQPHVRISELARRFNASTETLRRDLDTLAKDGLIDRAHGGATAPSHGHYPSLDERTVARIAEREGIARIAALEVMEGDTVMIDSGSTTIELAKALARRNLACTVITNSLPVAMTLGHGAADVMLCPGEYNADENAVVGTETLEFLQDFQVDRCMIGAAGFSTDGVSEMVRGFAAVKRQMLRQASLRQLLVGSEKFGQKGLARVAKLAKLHTIFVDARPKDDLLAALEFSGVDIRVAQSHPSNTE